MSVDPERILDTEELVDLPALDIEPSLFLGRLVSQEMVELEGIDYRVGSGGYIGINVRNLAKAAIETGSDTLWIRPHTLPTEVERTSTPEQFALMVFAQGAVQIDSGRRNLLVEEQLKHLSNQEFLVLEYLAKNRGLALTRDQIIQACLDNDYSTANIVDVYVSRIRKFLGNYRSLITTKHDFGYLFDDIKAAESI